jgi:hypothetical protein
MEHEKHLSSLRDLYGNIDKLSAEELGEKLGSIMKNMSEGVLGACHLITGFDIENIFDESGDKS